MTTARRTSGHRPKDGRFVNGAHLPRTAQTLVSYTDRKL